VIHDDYLRNATLKNWGTSVITASSWSCGGVLEAADGEVVGHDDDSLEVGKVRRVLR